MGSIGMPVIVPTPDELQRMSWHQRQRALARVRNEWPRAEYQEKPPTEPWQDPEHPDWAEDTRRKACEWLAQLDPDPQAAHRLDLWTTCPRRSTVSLLHPQISTTNPVQSAPNPCGQSISGSSGGQERTHGRAIVAS